MDYPSLAISPQPQAMLSIVLPEMSSLLVTVQEQPTFTIDTMPQATVSVEDKPQGSLKVIPAQQVSLSIGEVCSVSSVRRYSGTRRTSTRKRRRSNTARPKGGIGTN